MILLVRNYISDLDSVKQMTLKIRNFSEFEIA